MSKQAAALLLSGRDGKKPVPSHSTWRTLIAQNRVRAMKTRYTRVATMRPFSNILDSCRSGPIRNIVLQHTHTLIGATYSAPVAWLAFQWHHV